VTPIREISADATRLDDAPPPRRRRRSRADYDDEEEMVYAGKGASTGWILGIILGVCALIFAICMGIASLLNSGPGARHGGPPFGPLRR
jgi:hypothetical protein